MDTNMISFGPNMDVESYPLFDVPNLTGTPERRLLLAVLERAILDYVGNDPKEVKAASDWLFESLDSPPYGEFSLPWICQELDLDFEKVLGDIRKMPKRGNRRIAPWYFSESKLKEAS